jgi:hypothetical protein
MTIARKNENDVRNKRVNMVWSKNEIDHIDAMAKKYDVSRTEFVVLACMSVKDVQQRLVNRIYGGSTVENEAVI